jgi:hypothetical protein
MNARIDKIIVARDTRDSNVAHINYEGKEDGEDTKGKLGTLYFFNPDGVVLCGLSGRPSCIFRNVHDVYTHLQKYGAKVERA